MEKRDLFCFVLCWFLPKSEHLRYHLGVIFTPLLLQWHGVGVMTQKCN